MRHHLKLSIVPFLLIWCGSASAAFSTVTPPAGWSITGTQGMYQAAAGDTVLSGLLRGPVTSAAITGRSVSLPVALKYGSTAAQVAGRYAFANPALFIGTLAATEAYSYYVAGKLTVNPQTIVWEKTIPGDCSIGPCYQYSVQNNAGFSSAWAPKSSVGSACSQWISLYNSNNPNYPQNHYSFDSVNWSIPASPYCAVHNSYGAGQIPLAKREVPPDADKKAPATQAEFDQHTSANPLPDRMPFLLPIPLPVDKPIINPGPGSSPTPRPTRVTLGSPQLVPLSDPPQYKTPVIDIVPSPTDGEPWRIDAQPKDITSTDPTAPPDVATPPATPASGTTATPKGDQPPGLCDLYPDILACAKPKLGTLEPSTITNVDKPLSIQMDGGWGPSNGSCPAPKTVTVMNVHLSMPYTMLCDFATAIKPLLIAFAWLSAALTFFGMAKKD